LLLLKLILVHLEQLVYRNLNPRSQLLLNRLIWLLEIARQQLHRIRRQKFAQC
jgi:hypothetical protein